jgi:histidine ammonia-lyase
MTVTISPGAFTLADLARLAEGEALRLAEGWQHKVQAAHDALAARIAEGVPLYGINTGFGKLASTRIPPDQLAQLQVNLVQSHAAGVGAPLPAPVVRLTMALHAASLACGHSGVRVQVVETLVALLNAGVVPEIPGQGSVGASGDLAPLAHLALVLIGQGFATHDGARLTGAEALARAGLAPLVLGPKEGLALLNGTRVSAALAIAAHARATTLLQASLVIGALSVDGARGSDTPFDPRIHAVRGQKGQEATAATLRALLSGSQIRESHREGDTRVQDPYSLRCQPQVAGACHDLLASVATVLAAEANAVTDNPLVFGHDILSGGNFHAMPMAFASDQIALALATLGNIAERRIALLVDPVTSGLPAFLAPAPGLASGFMIAQVTAAALTAENRALAHPRSVETLPTSANQEDHVSMATGAGLRLAPMLDNFEAILAVEYLCAAQAVEFHRPLRSSAPLEEAIALLRAEVPRWEQDRVMAPDIEAARALLPALSPLAHFPLAGA